jgi:2-O-methyltransferase
MKKRILLSVLLIANCSTLLSRKKKQRRRQKKTEQKTTQATKRKRPSMPQINTDKSITIFNYPKEALNIAKPYLPENPVIVEAGAYDGKDSVYMANYWPKSSIHSFEPIPYLYRKTVLNTKKRKNINTYQLAVGESVGTCDMFVSEEPNNLGVPSMSSSLLAPKDHLKYSATLFPGKIIVRTTTFDVWAQENNIDHIDLMWLDMQGYELNALKASPNILSTVKVILTELEFVEAYEDQALFQEIKTWLEEQGFTMIAINKKYGWFGDGLFVRTDLFRGIK